MIPNSDPDLYVLVQPPGAPVERHRIRAWDSADGSPQVLDARGGLVAAHVLGTVRACEGDR